MKTIKTLTYDQRLVPLLVCLILLIPCYLSAQISYNKRGGSSVGVMPQPGNLSNDASLDGVDLPTGTLKVGIPLYEIKVKDITVPISLSYSALGLKADQKAGCVGMGWDLNAGGKITTIVNGIPDYDLKGLANHSFSPLLQLSAGGYMDEENNVSHRNFAVQALNNAGDAAWDVYAYSLPNGSGKFMRTGGNLLTFPYNPLFDLTAEGMSIGDGLRYRFESGDQKEIRKRTFYTKDIQPKYTTEWTKDYDPYTSSENLSYITSVKHKDTVLFNYERFEGAFTPWPKITTTMSVPVVREARYQLGSWVADPNYIIKEPSYSQTEVRIKVSTRLKNISFPSGRVLFNYDADYKGEDVLQSINIQQKEGNVYNTIKKFSFAYDMREAHYLKVITVSDKNDQVVYYWNFNYNDYLPVAQSFNATETTAQDRWGFYNGKTNNQTLVEDPNQILALQTKDHYPIYNFGHTSVGVYTIPKKSQESELIYGVGPNSLSFADREFVFSEAIKGTLKSIVTPTGARVEYEYEPHKFQHRRYSSSEPEIRTGGGIRIRSITHRSANTGKMLLRKEYKYGLLQNSEYASIPELEAGFGIVAYPANISTTFGIYGTSGNPSEYKVQNLSILSHATNDMSYLSVSYAMYRNVSEYLVKDTASTATNKYSGKTLYFFYVPGTNNLQDNSGFPSSLNLTLPLNVGVQNDNLYGKTEKFVKIRSNPTNFDPVERHIYTYKKYASPIPSVPQKSFSYFPSLSGVKAGYYSTASFNFCRSVLNPITNKFEIKCETLPINSSTEVDPLYFANIEFESSSSFYPGKYNGQLLKMNTYSDVYKMTSEDMAYYPDNFPSYITGKTTNYSYNNSLQPNVIASTDTEGKMVRQRNKYPLDYPANITELGIDAMKSSLLLSQPVEQLSTVEISGSEQVIGGTLDGSQSINGLLLQKDKYQLNTDGKLFPYSSLINTIDNRYELRKTFQQFDLKGNTQQFSETNGPNTALIWGYNSYYPIAEVTNAVFSDIAYTSFESDDTGNWTYTNASRQNSQTPIGKFSYSLSGGAITKNGLTATKSYVLAYWLKDGASPVISGGTIGTESIKRSYMGWKYIERKISSASSVTISGTGSIDDIRLHPLDALMKTYTYEPLIGITSVTDEIGKTSYYEYDSFQRLKQIKDQDGNVQKKVEYNYGY